MSIESGSFAEACFDMNSIEDLEDASIENADETDMKTWGLTADEWLRQIKLALVALKEAEAGE
jgi:hypothetical protein